MEVIREIPGFYRIVALKLFRKTAGVTFDIVPIDIFPKIDVIERVIYKGNATSPARVGDVVRPWFMHPAQEDNIVVLHGARKVDLYHPSVGAVETFIITPHEIVHNNQVVFRGGAMLSWSSGVFHRIMSDEKGSASFNFVVHLQGFEKTTLYNIYDLDTKTGEHKIIREGIADILR
ncbi:MAG TPA: hypothetical protein VK445_05325 [Dissulfurispiraceae bacterium]|nr:hypothetical protein [Dissulfurispiraceae bacterium]